MEEIDVGRQHLDASALSGLDVRVLARAADEIVISGLFRVVGREVRDLDLVRDVRVAVTLHVRERVEIDAVRRDSDLADEGRLLHDERRADGDVLRDVSARRSRAMRAMAMRPSR